MPWWATPELSGQRLLQRRDLAAQSSLGQLCQLGRVADPGQQRVQDRPPGLGQQGGGDTGELDAGVLEHLLQPLDDPGAFLDEHPAVAGQVPQLPDRCRRHEAGRDQPVLEQLGDPGRVGHVGLATRDVVQMLGIEQPDLGNPLLEQEVHRLPVHPGGLHAHQVDLLGDQPIAQRGQFGGRREEGERLRGAATARPRAPDGGDHGVAVHVQTGAAFHELIHCGTSTREDGVGRPAEACRSRSLKFALEAARPGAPDLPVILFSGLAAPSGSDVEPDGARIIDRPHQRGPPPATADSHHHRVPPAAA
jgi:hypothetical protein